MMASMTVSELRSSMCIKPWVVFNVTVSCLLLSCAFVIWLITLLAQQNSYSISQYAALWLHGDYQSDVTT